MARSKWYSKIIDALQKATTTIHQEIKNRNTAAIEKKLSQSVSDIENIVVRSMQTAYKLVTLCSSSTGNVTFQGGKTPLLYAAACGYYEGVEILIRHKANRFAVQQNVIFSSTNLC